MESAPGAETFQNLCLLCGSCQARFTGGTLAHFINSSFTCKSVCASSDGGAPLGAQHRCSGGHFSPSLADHRWAPSASELLGARFHAGTPCLTFCRTSKGVFLLTVEHLMDTCERTQLDFLPSLAAFLQGAAEIRRWKPELSSKVHSCVSSDPVSCWNLFSRLVHL